MTEDGRQNMEPTPAGKHQVSNIEQAREAKLHAINEMGIDPYGGRYEGAEPAAEIPAIPVIRIIETAVYKMAAAAAARLPAAQPRPIPAEALEMERQEVNYRAAQRRLLPGLRPRAGMAAAETEKISIPAVTAAAAEEEAIGAAAAVRTTTLPQAAAARATLAW